jgi:hypothetical protein
VRPANSENLGPSLAAARPVTASALLATFLCAAPGPFAAADAQSAVRAQLAGLPPGAFVDPEVRRAPDAAVAEALANLVARGTLAADGACYRLTDARGDARFPHVADMVTYQRNMLEETLAAARAFDLRGDG